MRFRLTEDRIRRRNRGHLLHRLPAERLAELRQPPTLPSVNGSRCFSSRSKSAAFFARWYSIIRAWCSANHNPIHAAKNCNGSGNSFSSVAVFALRPIRTFYALRSRL